MRHNLDKLASGGRALVRASRRGRALVKLPADKGRQLMRRLPEPVQVQLYSLSRRSLRLTLEVMAGLLVVSAVLLMLAYGRVSKGPISLGFLVPTLETAINRELADIEVKIDDVVVQRAEDNPRIVLRLRNIRLIDNEGAVVAQSPLAAFGLSGSALLSGRIAPGSVDFIGPRLLLFYSPDSGLALSFTRSESVAAAQPPPLRGPLASPGAPLATPLVTSSLPPDAAPAERAPAEPVPARRINLTQAVSDAFQKVRAGGTASSYLTRFGVRDAVVVLDRDGQQNQVQVPDFAIDLRHADRSSVMLGEARFESRDGPWQLSFQTEESELDERLAFKALVKDLVPTGLADSFPQLRALEALEMPLSAETSVQLSSAGELLGAEAQVSLAGGRINVPWDPYHPMTVDEGMLHVRFVADEKRIEVLPSTFAWGESRVTVAGDFAPIEPRNGMARWRFALHADDSVLAVEEFGVAPVDVDTWRAEGIVTPEAGHLEISRFLVRVGDAEIAFAGSVADGPGSPAVRLDGHIGPMTLASLIRIWPKFMSGGGRSWVGESVTGGKVTGGAFRVDLPAGALAELAAGGDVADSAVALDLEGAGLTIDYMDGMPPIVTGDVRAELRGRRFRLAVPEGRVDLPTGESVALSDGALAIDDLRPDIQQGEISFQVAGDAANVLRFLDLEPLGYARTVGIEPRDIGGTVQGAIAIGLPMIRDLAFDDVTLRGQARLEDASASAALAHARVEGGALTFNLTERALETRGEILVNDVPAQLSWQRIFDAPEDRQPDLRLSAVLDAAARERLGLDVNHLVRGPVPIVVSLPRGASDGLVARLRADLEGADLIVNNLGWRKPPGHAATLQVDLVDSGEGGTELQDFKIVGDDIAINGWFSLGPDNKPTAFYFPELSVNVITNLEISGRLRDDGVWDVQAHGPAYDGRQLFQSLFSAGQLGEAEAPRRQGDSVDLTARLGSVVGYFDTTVQDTVVTLRKRDGELRMLEARGTLANGAPIAAELQSVEGRPRVLLAESQDAGAAFRLVGFYPRVEGGQASLQVNLDGAGGKTGTLWARDFVILGDRVVGQVLSSASDDPMTAYRGSATRQPTVQRQRLVFNQLYAPFTVGDGRFVLHDSYINGPVLGATLRGNVDFVAESIDVGGTYVPLYGLNSALGSVPILGDLLVGRRGEGVLGITFAVQGPTAQPNVLVNPVSMVAPGIFRQMFEFTGPYPAQGAPGSRQWPASPGGSAQVRPN